MVCEWGMSEKMGPSSSASAKRWCPRAGDAQHQDYSEHTAMEIDREVRRIVMEHSTERRTGAPSLETLRHLAEALLEREVLDGPEIDAIVKGAGPGARRCRLGVAAAERRVLGVELHVLFTRNSHEPTGSCPSAGAAPRSLPPLSGGSVE